MRIIKLKTIALLFILATIFYGCKSNNVDTEEDEFYHGPPYITVCFVPMDGISKGEMTRLMKDFKDKFAETQFEPYFVDSFDAVATPDSCMNKKYNRLNAKKMLSFLNNKYSDLAKEKAVKNGVGKAPTLFHIIGVTNKDISTAVHGKENYGIMGLSYLSSGRCHASVISTYRLPRKQDLWKLATHEFCHGFYNAKHCPNNDPSCIMTDAKGGNPHLEKKDSLCLTCANWCLYGD